MPAKNIPVYYKIFSQPDYDENQAKHVDTIIEISTSSRKYKLLTERSTEEDELLDEIHYLGIDALGQKAVKLLPKFNALVNFDAQDITDHPESGLAKVIKFSFGADAVCLDQATPVKETSPEAQEPDSTSVLLPALT